MAKDVRAPRRLSGGRIALVLAWLLYIGALGGGAYYAFLTPGAEPTSEHPAEPHEARRAETSPTPLERAGADDPAEPAAQDVPPQDQPPAEPAPQHAVAPAEESATEPAAESAVGQPDSARAIASGETASAATGGPGDDRPAWKRFARPFDEADQRPRLAVVITGLGLSSAATEAAIRRLPPEISLSFSPYARGLDEWLALARANGHEVLLDLPMEPANFPADDPGPRALLTSLDESENLERLAWVLARGSGYVGLVSAMGARFTLSREHLHPVLERIKNEGLMLLDSRTTDGSLAGPLAAEIGLPVAVSDRALDVEQASSAAIDANLIYVERRALAVGAALAIAQPYPVAIERLVEWSGELDELGIALVPATAIVGKQHIRPLAGTSESSAAPSAAAPATPPVTAPAQ